MTQRIYSIWVICSIIFLFSIFFFPLLFSVPFKKTHKHILWLNYLWAWSFFKLAFIPVKVEWRFKLDKKQQYILCANHFSYLDIPALGLFPRPFKFVGKSQLKSIPLFGWMYDGLHITVNRSSYKSRARTLEKAKEALDDKNNLAFFPEGGVRFEEYPKMATFQNGAFRLSCEKNIPIIPITMVNNHAILPEDNKYLVSRQVCKIIYHAPVTPTGTSEHEIKKLKNTVANIIQSELLRRN